MSFDLRAVEPQAPGNLCLRHDKYTRDASDRLRQGSSSSSISKFACELYGLRSTPPQDQYCCILLVLDICHRIHVCYIW